jgi:hypothetical protein
VLIININQFPKGRRPNKSCSECAAQVEHLTPHSGKGGEGKLVICERCAAVSIWDGTKYLGLVTQEWMDLVLDTRFYPVLEEREDVVERLTAPPLGIINGTSQSPSKGN